MRAHLGSIHALCRRLSGDDTDAEDLAQEALIAIVRGLPRFDGRAAFSTWAYRVTTNSCLDELRRRSRRPRVVRSLGSNADDGVGPAPIDPIDQRPRAEERLGDRLAIDEALAELPAGLRAAVVLRDHLDLDYAEIARVLDIPPGTVRSRIARGRARLADRLRSLDAAGNQPSDADVEGGTP